MGGVTSAERGSGKVGALRLDFSGGGPLKRQELKEVQTDAEQGTVWERMCFVVRILV